MDTSIKWRNTDGKWQDFDLRDIGHMPRNHALNLFKNSTPVIAKEGDSYLTNNDGILSQYKSQNKKIMLFKDCQLSEKRFDEVGFLVKTAAAETPRP